MATRTSVTKAEDATGFEVAVAQGLDGFDRQEVVCTDVNGNDLNRLALNTYGTLSGLAGGGTGTVVTWNAPAGARLLGFHVIGTSDARVSVTINGTEKYFDLLSIVQPVCQVLLPRPDASVGGVTVLVRVTNALAGAGDYQAVILGE